MGALTESLWRSLDPKRNQKVSFIGQICMIWKVGKEEMSTFWLFILLY